MCHFPFRVAKAFKIGLQCSPLYPVIMKYFFHALLTKGIFYCSNAKGRLLVLSLDMGQSSSDNASLAVCPNFSSSFQVISTLSETVGHASERLSSNSLCSSPDDPYSDGAKMEETEPGQLRMVFQQSLSGAVLHVCPYLGRYVLASAGNTVSFVLKWL